jgi:hypothetical protein
MASKNGQELVEMHLFPLGRHVKTKFASKVIIFKETLEFKNAINLCY